VIQRVALLIAAGITAQLSAQTVPAYADFGIGGTACCLVPDGHGGNWVVGTYRQSTTTDPGSAVRVVHLNSAGTTTGTWTWGNTNSLQAGADVAAGAALDSSGNLIVVGTTNSGKFPVKGPQFTAANSANAGTGGFILRVDSGGNILSSSLISGAQFSYPSSPVVVGTDGSIYVSGDAPQAAFPTTNLAYRPLPPSDPYNPAPLLAFVMKLTPTANAIVWSALVGGSTVFGDDPDGAAGAASNVSAIAVTADGSVTIAGNTNAMDYPVTQKLVLPCECSEPQPWDVGYVTRLTPNGSSLVWSIYTGAGYNAGMALDADGSVVVTGAASESSFSTTPPASGGDTYAAFVMKINAAGSAVTASKLLGAGTEINPVAVVIDSGGRIVVNGTTASTTDAVIVSNFVDVLSSDLTQLISTFQTPVGAADAKVIPSPQFTVLGSSGSILQLPSQMPSSIALLGIANSGGTRVSPQVSPGEFVSFYGTFPGVVKGTGTAPGLNGVQVTFDGVASPLLYVSDTQINAVVPFEIAGRASTQMQIQVAATQLPPVTLPVVSTTPTIFAITHKDGRPVTLSDPVQPPETLVFWAGGAGVFQPALTTGEIVTSPPWPKPVLPVQVISNGQPLPIKFVGSAPGFIAGALQINVSVTSDLNCSPCHLQIGDTVTADVYPLGFQ
jgi:uncharacterized protein (TIGR03437 family)